MELRPYQNEAFRCVFGQWDSGISRTLLVLPTGCGKTVVFAKIAEKCVEMGERVLILAHRHELLEQASEKIEKITGLKCAYEEAEKSCFGSWFRVIVGSVQSLTRPQRLEKFPENYFSTIIIDEAHHAISESYMRILAHFSGAKILGVTATPDRGDMKNLGDFFQSVAYEYTLPQAIKNGYLSPIKAQTIPLKIDISKVGISGGDFKVSDIADALGPYLESIAEEMKKYCRNRRTVVFLPLIKTSQKFCQILNNSGFRATEVNGESKNRDEILSGFSDGKYNVLCNSMLLTEGWDCPAVDCIIVLRSTKIRSLYCQMIGRGTRLYKGKKDLLLLDFLWHTERHSLCRPACLISKNEELENKVTEKINNSEIPLDIGETEEEAEHEILQNREKILADELKKLKNRRSLLIDPVQYAISIQSETLSSYEPIFEWEKKAVSEQQKNVLEKRGFDPGMIQNAGQADKLIKACIQRSEAGLTTPKQIRILEKYGFENVGNWTFGQAQKMISGIASTGWRFAPGVAEPEKFVPGEK